MDIGGVILLNTATESDFEYLSGKFAQIFGIDPQILSKVRKAHLHEAMTGKYSVPDFFRDVSTLSGIELPNDVADIWIKATLPEIKVNQQLLQWIDKVRAELTMVVFTTISPLRLLIDQKLELFQHFDEQFLSTDLGMTKSDLRFYQYALDKMQIQPEDVLLIDDSPRNINIAESLGLNALLFLPEFAENFDSFLEAVGPFMVASNQQRN